MYIEKLRKEVKRALKTDKMRFRHTIGVADTAACLASRYGIDMQKAYISGLLHDCAKCVPDEKKIAECRQNTRAAHSARGKPAPHHRGAVADKLRLFARDVQGARRPHRRRRG